MCSSRQDLQEALVVAAVELMRLNSHLVEWCLTWLIVGSYIVVAIVAVIDVAIAAFVFAGLEVAVVAVVVEDLVLVVATDAVIVVVEHWAELVGFAVVVVVAVEVEE